MIKSNLGQIGQEFDPIANACKTNVKDRNLSSRILRLCFCGPLPRCGNSSLSESPGVQQFHEELDHAEPPPPQQVNFNNRPNTHDCH